MRDGPDQIKRDELLERYSDHRLEIKEKFALCWYVEIVYFTYLFGFIPILNNSFNRVCPVVQSWLFGYDAHEEVDIALKSTPFI